MAKQTITITYPTSLAEKLDGKDPIEVYAESKGGGGEGTAIAFIEASIQDDFKKSVYKHVQDFVLPNKNKESLDSLKSLINGK